MRLPLKEHRADWEPKLRRRGFVLVAVLVCLTVVMLLTTAMVRETVLADRRQRLQELELQANWLLQAGCDRAAARLRHTPDFAGEVWEPAEGQLPHGTAARIAIRVQPLADAETGRETVIEVTYPLHAEHPIHKTRVERWPLIPPSPPTKE